MLQGSNSLLRVGHCSKVNARVNNRSRGPETNGRGSRWLHKDQKRLDGLRHSRSRGGGRSLDDVGLEFLQLLNELGVLQTPVDGRLADAGFMGSNLDGRPATQGCQWSFLAVGFAFSGCRARSMDWWCFRPFARQALFSSFFCLSWSLGNEESPAAIALFDLGSTFTL